MRIIPAFLVACWVMFLAGCAPPTDNVLRRWNTASEKETSNVGSSSGYELFTLGQRRMQLFSHMENSDFIDGGTRNVIRSFGPIIKRYADSYQLDWRLVLATMKQESRFHPGAESHKGARGLMQIMPLTADQIVERLGLTDLEDPQDNIHGGVYYLRWLYDLFPGAPEGDRIRLALAAYNAGVGRVNDAQELAEHLNLNPMEWQAVREALPLLSRRHRDLHEDVWEKEKPRSGWFGNSRETIAFVEGVMNHYDEYRLVLN
jgi:hypothetical protein